MIMTTNNLTEINFAPADVYEEVAQNISMILKTVKGTVPLARNFGISQQLVDLPSKVAQTKLTAEIFQAVKKFEPRAKILSVKFANQLVEGKLPVNVVFSC